MAVRIVCYCLASILLSRLLVSWKESARGGLVFRLGGSNRRVEGPSYLFDTISIFPESGLEGPQRIMEAAPRLKQRLVCWRDVGVIQGLGRGECGWVFGRPYSPRRLPVSCICRCQERVGGHPSSFPW